MRIGIIKKVIIIACLAGGVEMRAGSVEVPAADSINVPRMVEIPAGSFVMGSDGREAPYSQDETPAHEVSLPAFRMSACEITNAQFEAFCPEHKALRGSEFGISTEDDEAVAYVSWYDAVNYCRWLSEKTGRHFRLPTEAEWEYA